MAVYVQETMKRCGMCKKVTKHARKNTKSSGLMVMIHFLLILMTAGLWLIVIALVKILELRIGGWKCMRCISNDG